MRLHSRPSGCAGTPAGMPVCDRCEAVATTTRPSTRRRKPAAPRVSNVLATMLLFLLIAVGTVLGDPTLSEPQSGTVTLPANFAIDFTIASNAVAVSFEGSESITHLIARQLETNRNIVRARLLLRSSPRAWGRAPHRSTFTLAAFFSFELFKITFGSDFESA